VKAPTPCGSTAYPVAILQSPSDNNVAARIGARRGRARRPLLAIRHKATLSILASVALISEWCYSVPRGKESDGDFLVPKKAQKGTPYAKHGPPDPLT
jgi:hypothetical protein